MRPVCLVRPFIAALVLSAVGTWVGQALAQPSLQPPLQPAQPALHPTQSKKSTSSQPCAIAAGLAKHCAVEAKQCAAQR